MSTFEVVFVESGVASAHRRVVALAPGHPVPRIGECVILDLDPGAQARWTVEDVAHVYEDDRFGIVVKLARPRPA